MDTRSASKRWTGRCAGSRRYRIDRCRFGRAGRRCSPPGRRQKLRATIAQCHAPGAAAGARGGTPATAGAAASGVQPPRNRWLGPLAGLAAGLGIAALLSHFGMMGPFAEMLGSMLMIGLLIVAAVVIWRLLRARVRDLQGRSNADWSRRINLRRCGFPAGPTSQNYDNVSAGARPGSVAALSRGADVARPASAGRSGCARRLRRAGISAQCQGVFSASAGGVGCTRSRGHPRVHHAGSVRRDQDADRRAQGRDRPHRSVRPRCTIARHRRSGPTATWRACASPAGCAKLRTGRWSRSRRSGILRSP